eukprot:Em0008g587a
MRWSWRENWRLLSRHRGACAKKDGTRFQPQLSCPSFKLHGAGGRDLPPAVTLRPNIRRMLKVNSNYTSSGGSKWKGSSTGRSMSAGGEVVILQFNQLGPMVCDAVVMESISIPANCEFQLVATLMVDGKMCRISNVGILEPQPNFMERHGLAVAHSVAINRDGAIPVQMLNPDSDIGRTCPVQHRIDTQSANPVKQPPRRLPFHRREEIKRMLNDMLAQGVIEPATGPWPSPVVLLQKKDGSTSRTVQEHFQNLTEVFQRLKQAEAFIVDCNASDDGLGTVLSQNHQGAEHVVYYASRTLTKAERWLRSFKEPEGQVARCLEHLVEYEFTVQHRPGKKNGNADPLSRYPCHQCSNQPVGVHVHATTDQRGSNVGGWALQWSKQEIIQFQTDDPDIGQMKRWMKEALPQTCPHNASKVLKSLWSQTTNLVLVDDVLHRSWKDVAGKGLNNCLQMVMPHVLVPYILAELHDAPKRGHLGVVKVLESTAEVLLGGPAEGCRTGVQNKYYM